MTRREAYPDFLEPVPYHDVSISGSAVHHHRHASERRGHFLPVPSRNSALGQLYVRELWPHASMRDSRRSRKRVRRISSSCCHMDATNALAVGVQTEYASSRCVAMSSPSPHVSYSDVWHTTRLPSVRVSVRDIGRPNFVHKASGVCEVRLRKLVEVRSPLIAATCRAYLTPSSRHELGAVSVLGMNTYTNAKRPTSMWLDV